MTQIIMNNLIQLIFTILSTVITVILIPALSNWLKSKTENEKIQAVISDLSATVETAVNYYEQTVVAGLKEDGEWNSDTQQEVLKDAVNTAMESLMDTTKKTISDNGISLQDVVTRYVESCIQTNK